MTYSGVELSVKIKVADKTIITEEDQNVLMYIRDVERTNYFLIGDIANKYIARSSEHSLPVTHQQIFDAIGRFCGKKGRTIRYYSETAAYFEREEREEFDMLPFSFFVFARKTGEQSRDVLEYAARNPYMTLDGLKAAFVIRDNDKKNYEEDEFESERYEQLSFGQNGDEYSPSAEYISPAKKFSNSVLISTISELVDAFDRLVERANLSESTRTRILRAVGEIRDLIPEILQSLNESQGEL